MGDNFDFAVLFRDWIKVKRRNLGHPEVHDEDGTIYNEILPKGSCDGECEEFDKDIPILEEEPHKIIAQSEGISKVI